VTTLSERRLFWDACQNVRDSGGLPTIDGSFIRPSALIRSDNHDRLTAAGQANVRAMGISLILDVRAEWEAEKFRSPFAHEAWYQNISLFDNDEEGRALVSAAADLSSVYRIMLDRYPRLLGQVLAAIADAPPGGVVVHCHAGKDRTGMVVALALSIAGVAADVVAQDYALTDECLQEHYAAELAQQTDPAKREQLRSWQQTKPETMLGVLEHLSQRYGGVEQYLINASVSSDQLAKLSARLRV